MEFNDAKTIIREGLNLVNSDLYDKFYGLDIVPVVGFFNKEIDRVEKQLSNDIIIQQLNIDYINQVIYPFLNQIHYILSNFKHDQNFRRFAEQIILFLSNWIKLLDKNNDILMTVKSQLEQYINMIHNDLLMWYSLMDLILEANKQIDTLRKWNSFRPAGFEVAPHMLKILTEDSKDGGQCGCK